MLLPSRHISCSLPHTGVILLSLVNIRPYSFCPSRCLILFRALPNFDDISILSIGTALITVSEGSLDCLQQPSCSIMGEQVTNHVAFQSAGLFTHLRMNIVQAVLRYSVYLLPCSDFFISDLMLMFTTMFNATNFHPLSSVSACFSIHFYSSMFNEPC